MAAPDYKTNLAVINLAEVSTGWSRSAANPYDGGGNALEQIGPDYFIQGSNSWAWASNTRNVSGLYDNGTGITLADSDHVYYWLFIGPASGAEPLLGSTGASGSYAGDGGGTLFIGTATNQRIIYAVAGPETYGAGGRNYINYPIYYDTTVATDSDKLVQGSPGASPSIFGGGVNFQSTARGPNAALDAIRYGNAISVTEGGGSDPGTFFGINEFNDSDQARLGVFTGVGGGYELQGRLSIGETTARVADSCYFVDPGTSIVIPEIRHCKDDFTQIRLSGGATSKISLTSLSYTALSDINNRGVFRCVSKVADIDLVRCVMDNIETIELGKSTTVQSTTWQNCNEVLQDSATITDCSFSNSRSTRAATIVNNSTAITGTTWTSAGTGHAIELVLPGTYDANNWTFVGYNDSTGTNILSNNGSTDASVYNNTGGAVTINLVGGTTNFSVRNGAGASTTLVAASTVSITGILGLSEVTVLESPSPLSATSLPAPTAVEINTTERISANIIVGNGTDYVSYSNNGGFVQINANGSAAFTTIPGVLSDSLGNLADGDEVCVQVRDDTDNPTLQLADVFEVSGTPNSTTILTKTSFATFSSKFGTVINSSNSKTVAVEKKDATYNFSTETGTIYDISVFRIGSDPILLTNQVASTGNLPVSQSPDGNYRDVP